MNPHTVCAAGEVEVVSENTPEHKTSSYTHTHTHTVNIQHVLQIHGCDGCVQVHHQDTTLGAGTYAVMVSAWQSECRLVGEFKNDRVQRQFSVPT